MKKINLENRCFHNLLLPQELLSHKMMFEYLSIVVATMRKRGKEEELGFVVPYIGCCIGNHDRAKSGFDICV